MAWSVVFRVRRSLRESLWVLPLLGRPARLAPRPRLQRRQLAHRAEPEVDVFVVDRRVGARVGRPRNGGASIQVVRRLRAMLEKLSEAVLPERREAALRELQRLDEAVAGTWGGTVDLDLAVMADRQGVGGPSARRE